MTVQTIDDAAKTLALMETWGISVHKSACRRLWVASAWSHLATSITQRGSSIAAVVAALVAEMEAKGYQPYRRPGG